MNSLIKDKITPVINSKQICQNGGQEKFSCQIQNKQLTKNHEGEGKNLRAIENLLSQWSTCDNTVMYCNNTVYYKAKCPFHSKQQTTVILM